MKVMIGNYRLDHQTLGKGSFARVVLATHVILNEKVALKIIKVNEIKKLYEIKNLHREEKILIGLPRHRNIVRLYEVISSTTKYTRLNCLAMEYINGGNLLEYLRKNKESKVDEKECRSFSRQIISGLNHLHKNGILHRDLKLQNILIDASSENKRIVLIDFGLSCGDYQPGKLFSTHCGSPEYAAPEMFLHIQEYTEKVDIWSFGIVLYTLSTGKLPFSIDDDDDKRGYSMPFLISILKGLRKDVHGQVMKSLSNQCQTVINQCLQPDPAFRADMKQLTNSSWLNNEEGNCELPPISSLKSSVKIKDEIFIAKQLKQIFKSTIESEQILMHVKRKPFGTTGGCYNILAKKIETNEYPSSNAISHFKFIKNPAKEKMSNLTSISNKSSKKSNDNERSSYDLRPLPKRRFALRDISNIYSK